ncbi:MAG: nitrogen fixation protein NifQ, partial [Bradyrhizobium guangdongense]
MIAAQARTIEATSRPPAGPDAGETHDGIEFYRMLTGRDPAETDIRDDEDFDRHVLASILSAAAMDGGPIAERAGLTEPEFNDLLASCFPSAELRAFAWMPRPGSAADDETIMVRDLLLAQRSTEGNLGRWLAA